MLHPDWIERDDPPARCPLPACRRSGTCHHSTDQDPCRRLHQSRDECRNALAARIERLTRAQRAKPGWQQNVAEEGSPEFERRMKILYDLLRAADEAGSARQREAAQKADGSPQHPAKQEKPARPSRRRA